MYEVTSRTAIAGEIPPEQPLFYDRHKEELATLFGVLGMPPDPLETLEETVAVTQIWTKGDHTQPAYDLLLTGEQSSVLTGLFQDFGLLEERPLPPGHYYQLLGLGGKQAGNNRRLDFVRRTLAAGGVTTESITMLGGQRPMDPKDEKAPVEINLENLREKRITDPWTQNILSGFEGLRWETDLIRLAAADQLGPMALKQLHLRLDSADPIGRYEMEWQGIPVTLMHSLAVHRPGGRPRHTTESCMTDWVELKNPPEGAKVGLIAANPHIERTARSARAILKNLGREDIELIGAGSAAGANQDPEIFLGEIGRHLYEDLKASA